MPRQVRDNNDDDEPSGISNNSRDYNNNQVSSRNVDIFSIDIRETGEGQQQEQENLHECIEINSSNETTEEYSVPDDDDDLMIFSSSSSEESLSATLTDDSSDLIESTSSGDIYEPSTSDDDDYEDEDSDDDEDEDEEDDDDDDDENNIADSWDSSRSNRERVQILANEAPRETRAQERQRHEEALRERDRRRAELIPAPPPVVPSILLERGYLDGGDSVSSPPLSDFDMLEEFSKLYNERIRKHADYLAGELFPLPKDDRCLHELHRQFLRIFFDLRLAKEDLSRAKLALMHEIQDRNEYLEIIKKKNDRDAALTSGNDDDDSNNKDHDDKGKCVICLTNEPDIAIIECGHVATCSKCSQSLESCPMCREVVEGKLKVYRL